MLKLANKSTVGAYSFLIDLLGKFESRQKNGKSRVHDIVVRTKIPSQLGLYLGCLSLRIAPLPSAPLLEISHKLTLVSWMGTVIGYVKLAH